MENTEQQIPNEQEIIDPATTILQPESETTGEAPPSPVNSANENEHQTESSQAVNIKNLRELKDRAEFERDTLLKRVDAMEQANKKPEPTPEPQEDFAIAPDDIVEGKHLSRYDRKIKELEGKLKTYQEQSTAVSVEAKLQAQYPDFEKIVTQENIGLLTKAYPELAQTINSSSDLYSKAVSAYTMIKKLGIQPGNTYEAEKTKAHMNASKPRPLASVGSQQGDSPLTKANAFADGLTEDLKKQLYKETLEAMKNC